MKYVIKRDGTKVKFEKEKIINAVNACANSMGTTIKQSVVNLLADNVSKIEKDTSVEDIQDIVVKYLMDFTEYKDLVLEYERYRTIRTKNRDVNKMFTSISDIISIGSTENANKNSEKGNVKRDLTAGEVAKFIACNNVLSPELVQAHFDKIFHWHDLDFMLSEMTNCSVIKLADMLYNGTVINNAQIVRPNSIEVASNITAQIIADVANSQYGGISIHAINEVWAPYAKKTFAKNFLKYIVSDYMSLVDIKDIDFMSSHLKDNYITMTPEEITSIEQKLSRVFDKAIGILNDRFNLCLTKDDICYSNDILKNKFQKTWLLAKMETEKNIYDACQSYEYQMNTLSSASQTPFSTISFDIPTSWYSQEIVSSYFKVRMRGIDATGKIAIFPKINLFVVDGKNLNSGDEYFYLLELAAKCISKAFYPDILHVTKKEYETGDYNTRMGCRSNPSHVKINGEYQPDGRFNYGVQSLNIVKQAILSKDVDDFFIKLKSASNIIQLAIETRYNFVKNMKAKAAPILFMHGGLARLNAEDTIEPLLKTDLASISYGYVGISDAVNVLLGKSAYEETELGKELGLRIIRFLSDECARIKEETGLPVSLYGTPAESLIHNFFQADLKLHGDLMPEWLKNKQYYENSYHYCSSHDNNAFDKLEFEGAFMPYSKGGNIVYSELPTAKDNTTCIIELIQFAHELGTISYQGFNVGADTCLECGYVGSIKMKDNKYTCPQCGNNDKDRMNVIKRLCGYLTDANKRGSSNGRNLEVQNRVKHINDGPVKIKNIKAK